MKVSIEDTEHEGLFGFKKLLFLKFTTWIIDWIQDLSALVGLGNYEYASLKPSKYLSSLREGYAALSLLIPFLKPISSITAGEYQVGLDEGMGQEGAHWDWVDAELNRSSTLLKFVGTIHQV